MKSWFLIKNTHTPLQIDDDIDVRFPIELPKKFIEEYTNERGLVFDPFAGFGTTLFAAQELGRIGIGIEYEKKRADSITAHLQLPSRIIHGDSRKISTYDLPHFDLCFTSPPYMRSFDNENPMTNYSEQGTYNEYLEQIKKIYQQVKKIMKKDARVIVEIENTYEKGKPVTPLAWDVAAALSDIFFFEKDMVACNETGENPKTNHSYILIFRNR